MYTLYKSNGITIHFRPSSHSTDYTAIGIFKDARVARKVAERVGGSRRGNRVVIRDYVDCEIDDIESDIADQMRGFPENPFKVYTYYSHLKITIKIPKAASENVAMLLMPRDAARLLHKLSELCPPPIIVNQKTCSKLVYDYEGNLIYASDSTLYFGGNQEIALSSTLKVRQLTALQ
jgi:hypothetical protein